MYYLQMNYHLFQDDRIKKITIIKYDMDICYY